MDEGSSQIYESSSKTAAEMITQMVRGEDPWSGGVEMFPAAGFELMWYFWGQEYLSCATCFCGQTTLRSKYGDRGGYYKWSAG